MAETPASVVFDLDDLELGEIEDIEDVAEVRFAKVVIDFQTCATCDQQHDGKCGTCGEVHVTQSEDVGAKGKPKRPPRYDHPWKSRFDHDFFPNLSGKELTAIGWILARRANPEFTLEEARSSRINSIFGAAPSTNGQSVPKDSSDSGNATSTGS